MKSTFYKIIIGFFVIFFTGFLNVTAQNSSSSSDVFGYGFLNRITGLWNGPVTSTTSSGSFPAWYVDFRPVAANQVSQFSKLDSSTVNNMSFFVVKFQNQLKIAMRTEGCFNDKCCITYEIMDSVNEKTGYYRFSDFISKEKRAYTEFQFTKNELVMQVFTNKFNLEKKTKIHSRWAATCASKNEAETMAKIYNYPQSVPVADFTDAFKNMNESIFFTFENDPYPSSKQPAMGSLAVNIEIEKKLRLKKTDEICLLLTTQPLFCGIKYNKEQLKYISKYVYLPIDTRNYTIRNLHPGTYYLYSYVDVNFDKHHRTGDYMSSDVTNVAEIKVGQEYKINTIIDMVIP